MSYERFIAWRYLMAKKRSQVVSIITLISVCGVALGVTALIVVLSVMGGFKKDLKDKILGTKAHAVVKPAKGEDIVDYRKAAEQARHIHGVVGAEPYVEAEVMVSSPTNLSGVVLRGVEPKRVGEVSDLAADMVKGKLEYLKNPRPLMKKLDAEREKHIDEILKRVGKDRDDFAKEKAAKADAGSPPTGPPEAGSADAGPAKADQMPPLPGQESGAPPAPATKDGAQSNDGEDVMPPIFEDQDNGSAAKKGAKTDGGDAMPPIFGADDSGADQGGSSSGAESDDEKLPGIVVGIELAKSLQTKLGSEINVVTPEGQMGPTGMMPRSRPFRVVGIFKSGMYEYDANYAYTGFDDATDFLNRKGASGIEIKTVDPNQAIAIAAVLQKKLGSKYNVLDWKEMNRSLFFALELEKIAMFVVLAFIILVASFSIVAMLIMIVIEKARDIAILKSMGVTSGGVARIFVFQGLVIGALGTLIGVVLGLLICWYLKVYGVPLDSEVYYISKLPVDVNPVEVASIIICSLVISLGATWYPSYLASKLKPVDGLRYD